MIANGLTWMRISPQAAQNMLRTFEAKTVVFCSLASLVEQSCGLFVTVLTIAEKNGMNGGYFGKFLQIFAFLVMWILTGKAMFSLPSY